MAKSTEPDTKLSVLILSPHPSVPGGVSFFVETLKAHFRHCRATSVWVGQPAEKNETLVSKLVRLVFLPVRVAWLVHRKKFDVVHINPSLDLKAVVRDGLVLVALRLIGYSRVLVYVHGWRKDTAENLRKPIFHAVFLWLMGGVARVTVLAPEFKDALVSLGVEPQKIIFTTTLFDGDALKCADDEAKPQRRSILFLSRFEIEKGIYELLEAFARLATDYPDCDLVFAGGGEEKSGLEKKVEALGLSQRVLFPGYVTGQDKARVLNQCALFALPTRYGEGMPVAILEALGAGKALLTTGVGGISAIVREPENGIVLEQVSVDAIEKALRQLLDNPDLCSQIGQRNKAYAYGQFEAAVVTEKMETMYQDIAGRELTAVPD